MRNADTAGRVLFAWIGDSDLKAAGLERPRRRPPRADAGSQPGPIARVLADPALCPDRLVIIDDSGQGEEYKRRMQDQWPEFRELGDRVTVVPVAAAGDFKPADLASVYEAARTAVQQHALGKGETRNYLISSGTPTMMLASVLLSETRGFEATLLQSSIEEGARAVQLPIDLAYQYLPQQIDADGTVAAPALRVSNTQAFAQIVCAASSPVREALALAEAIARTGLPALITGESGTGKELVARHIHEAAGGGPFVAINCSAIPADLFENELFGYAPGAFTDARKGGKEGLFEEARNGTLFLDELGELALPHQAKLLRALQEKKARRVSGDEYDIKCRIVVATHRDLLEEVRRGRFREDLFYRLAAYPINLPPLRERPEDLKPLTESFMQRPLVEHGDAHYPCELSPEAWRLLFAHRWPGNIRELEFTLLRAKLMSGLRAETQVSGTTMKQALISAGTSGQLDLVDRPLGEGFTFDDVVDELKYHYYLRAMRMAQGNLSQAARLLGRSRISDWLKDWSDEKRDAWRD